MMAVISFISRSSPCVPSVADRRRPVSACWLRSRPASSSSSSTRRPIVEVDDLGEDERDDDREGERRDRRRRAGRSAGRCRRRRTAPSKPSALTVGVGEEAEQQRADDAADEVDGDHVERVVVAEACTSAGWRGSRATPAMKPMMSGAMPADEAGARRDGDEAGDGTGGGAEGRGVAVLDALDEQPAEHGGRGGEVGVHERLGGEAVGAEGRAGVEAEPAEPQDAGAEQRPAAGCAAAWPRSGQPLRLPRTSTTARAAMPALMWTTVPPAKSSAPMLEQPARRAEHPVGDRAVHEHRPQAEERRRRPRTSGGRPWRR